MAEPLRRDPRSDDHGPETDAGRKRRSLREIPQPPSPPVTKLTMCGCTGTAPSAQVSELP